MQEFEEKKNQFGKGNTLAETKGLIQPALLKICGIYQKKKLSSVTTGMKLDPVLSFDIHTRRLTTTALQMQEFSETQLMAFLERYQRF